MNTIFLLPFAARLVLSKIPTCTVFDQQLNVEHKSFYQMGQNETGTVRTNYLPKSLSEISQDQRTDVVQLESRADCAKKCSEEDECNFWVFQLSARECIMWKDVPAKILTDLESYDQNLEKSYYSAFGVKCEGNLTDHAKIKPYDGDAQPQCIDGLQHNQTLEAGQGSSTAALGWIPKAVLSLPTKPARLELVKDQSACAAVCLYMPFCNYWAWEQDTPNSGYCHQWTELPDDVKLDVSHQQWVEKTKSAYGSKCQGLMTEKAVAPTPDSHKLPPGPCSCNANETAAQLEALIKTMKELEASM